ncbi:MAG TPA: hypothetical protein VFQ77_17045 [Pseudonocardiaceae bacterium]|jgi:hypothetical protein|nr:hypothetical protein [Pseudonocardiaceae bacterium]
MRLRNLTPHPVTITTGSGSVYLAPEPDTRPQVDEVVEMREPVLVEGLSVPIVQVAVGVLVGLPEPAPDTLLMVSRVVAEARPERTDLLVPYDLVRDEAGRVVACRCLARISSPSSSFTRSG